jgi:hypothetical protein
MKQRKALVLTASILALSILACQVGGISPGDRRTIRGSGEVVEEVRAANGVSGVDLATMGTLHIEVGDRESLRVEAQDNLMEYLETEVRNGQLRIGTRNRVRLRSTRPIHYYLTVTGLDTIAISSSGDIEAPDLQAERFSITIASTGDLEMGDLEADTLTVKTSSSGDVTMGKLNADTLEVNISSTGDLDIAGGEVKTQQVTITSSGRYTAQDLASEEADVRLTSSGSATIWVQDNLKASLSSSGDLRYRGDPTVDATTTSSGDVTPIGE